MSPPVSLMLAMVVVVLGMGAVGVALLLSSFNVPCDFTFTERSFIHFLNDGADDVDFTTELVGGVRSDPPLSSSTASAALSVRDRFRIDSRNLSAPLTYNGSLPIADADTGSRTGSRPGSGSGLPSSPLDSSKAISCFNRSISDVSISAPPPASASPPALVLMPAAAAPICKAAVSGTAVDVAPCAVTASAAGARGSGSIGSYLTYE